MPRPARTQTRRSAAAELETRLAIVRYRRGVLLLDHNDFKAQYRTSYGEFAQFRIQISEAQKQAQSALADNRSAEHEQKEKVVTELNERMASSVRECEKLVARIEKMAEAIRKRDEEIDELEDMLRVARTWRFWKNKFFVVGRIFFFFLVWEGGLIWGLGSENEIIRFSWLRGYFLSLAEKG